MTSSPPPSGSSVPGPAAPATTDGPHAGWTDVRFRAWNLLLLVPLISVIPPLFNVRAPALGGLPFFYWFQLLVIPIGIAATVTVHLVTRSPDEDAAPGSSVDALDEGSRR